jgi:hypothetical protein
MFGNESLFKAEQETPVEPPNEQTTLRITAAFSANASARCSLSLSDFKDSGLIWKYRKMPSQGLLTAMHVFRVLTSFMAAHLQ